MWHCQSVSVVCVPSLSVVQPLDCWSDPMALVALTLWGSGASRRRQSLPDDLHGCQSCPGDSEHNACTQGARFLQTSLPARIYTTDPRGHWAFLRAFARLSPCAERH